MRVRTLTAARHETPRVRQTASCKLPQRLNLKAGGAERSKTRKAVSNRGANMPAKLDDAVHRPITMSVITEVTPHSNENHTGNPDR